jgi:large subunit ribosomal protein L24
MKNRIKKNDLVQVITGKDKNKQGKVLEVLPRKGKVRVEGVNLVTKHQKARRQGEASAITKIEGLIDISNVMPIDPSSKKPTRACLLKD